MSGQALVLAPPPDPNNRPCRRCGTVKPEAKYSGANRVCNECIAAEHKAKRDANHAEYLERERVWRAGNAEARRAYQRQYRAEHLDERRAWHKQYSQRPSVKEHRKEVIKQYQAKHGATIKLKRAEWYQREAERVRMKVQVSARGITTETYQAMLSAQNGLCAVCCRPETAKVNGRRRALAIDHCHETNRVRGLLCTNCNSALGLLADDPVRITALLSYLAKYQQR